MLAGKGGEGGADGAGGGEGLRCLLDGGKRKEMLAWKKERVKHNIKEIEEGIVLSWREIPLK